MKLFKFLIPLYCVFLLLSCQSQVEDNKKLHQNLMSLHDEEMAMMDDIYNLKKALKAIQDTLTDVATQDQIEVKINKLNAADSAMMQWMRKYQEPEESKDPEEIRKYYLQQLEEIKKIKTLMDSSIYAATTYLKGHEIPHK